MTFKSADQSDGAGEYRAGYGSGIFRSRYPILYFKDWVRSPMIIRMRAILLF